MKKYEKILSSVSLLFLGITMASCSDFLDEKLTTQQNTDYFNTSEGIDKLEVSLYYNLRFHFAKEWACATTSYSDEFRVGGDGSNASWNNYDGNFQSEVVSNSTKMNEVWDGMYIGINNANLLLSKITSKTYTGSNKDLYLGEAYFLRGFNYLKLVSQYGGVPLKLTPSTSPEREFTRATAQETMNQVIDDLKKAYQYLPSKVSMLGKMTKDAAAHFLAKAYLLRASEINNDWNNSTKSADLAEALKLSQEVISHHQLATNFSDLWNYTTPNGKNEQLDEILLSAQFSSDKSTQGANGNQCHLYFVSVYKDLPQMQRDIAGEREYQRMRTTYYMYNIYDMVNDSRFWKSFKTKYAVNNPKTTKYTYGDLGIMYVINRPGDTRFDEVQLKDKVVYEKTGKTIPTVFVAYPKDRNGKGDEALYDYTSRFCTLSKYIDGSREQRDSRVGFRDGILARLGETYLIAAEALIRQGNYNEALTYINKLRQRAAYKEGENRSAYCDGGAAYNEKALGYKADKVNSYFPENSYYESNNIERTTTSTNLDIKDIHKFPAEDENVIAKLGYTSDYDRMMCLLLNERSRELCGEFHRWEDLSRTKTLVSRVRAFNPDAAPNIQDRHNLRPIPQSYLDAIQKDGRSLTAEEKKAQQNPGY
jgi:hypothetical protein